MADQYEEVFCTACGGTGKYTALVDGTLQRVDCTSCNGTGTVKKKKKKK